MPGLRSGSTAAGAEQVLLARLERSIAARQSLEAEIEALGRMRSKESLPLLLAAAEPAKPVDRGPPSPRLGAGPIWATTGPCPC